MNAHHLHLDGIEGCGYPTWRFTCDHGPNDPAWIPRRIEDGEPDTDLGDCYLASWWDACGDELIDAIPGPITFPIPVRPSDGWDFEDGGTLVRDEADL